jgi:hypothetical protein
MKISTFVDDPIARSSILLYVPCRVLGDSE